MLETITMADSPFDATMKRQADMLRAVLNASTPDNPITLSPNLYDKLRPEQRYRFRRR